MTTASAIITIIFTLVGYLAAYSALYAGIWKETQSEVLDWEAYSKEFGIINPLKRNRIGEKLRANRYKVGIVGAILLGTYSTILHAYCNYGFINNLVYLIIASILMVSAIVDMQYYYLPGILSAIATAMAFLLSIYSLTSKVTLLESILITGGIHLISYILYIIISVVGAGAIGGGDLKLVNIYVLIMLSQGLLGPGMDILEAIMNFNYFILISCILTIMYSLVAKKVNKIDNIKKTPVSAGQCIYISILLSTLFL